MKDINVEGSENIASGRDTNLTRSVSNNYHLAVSDSESEIGIINNIFDYVAKVASQTEINVKVNDTKLLHINEKINLNFEKKEDRLEIRGYFTELYKNIHWVEKCFQSIDEFNQNCIHHYIRNKYNDLKIHEQNKILLLKSLTTFFIPPKQSKNPMYFTIAQSIVLFFFDDCTIFEKTEKEKARVLDLFKDLEC